MQLVSRHMSYGRQICSHGMQLRQKYVVTGCNWSGEGGKYVVAGCN